MKKTLLHSLILLFSFTIFASEELTYNSEGILHLENGKTTITNNTIIFDGITTLTGSTPLGGNGTYFYSWEIWVLESGTGSTPFIGGDKDLTLKVGQVQTAHNIGIYFRRKVISDGEVSYSNWAGPKFDPDGDGIDLLEDNCPYKSNPSQADADGDGVGDVCDNCPSISNSNQINVCKDSDNDGVLDISDNCPNTPNSNQSDIDNDGIGDVCDSVNNNTVDLSFDDISTLADSDCFSCRLNIYDLNRNSERHIINKDGTSLSISQIIIENNGYISSPNSKISYFLSLDNTLSDNDWEFTKTTNIPSINPGSYVNLNQNLTGSDFENTEAPYGNFFLIMKIDKDDQIIDESNQDNNILTFRVKYREDAFSKSSSLEKSMKSLYVATKNQNRTNYTLSVFDLNGINIIREKNVKDKKDEELFLKNLKNGIYILKINLETKKILINN
jgi:hypothetical protein